MALVSMSIRNGMPPMPFARVASILAGEAIRSWRAYCAASSNRYVRQARELTILLTTMPEIVDYLEGKIERLDDAHMVDEADGLRQALAVLLSKGTRQ